MPGACFTEIKKTKKTTKGTAGRAVSQIRRATEIRKTPKSILICIMTFLVLGFIIGYSSILILSKNDSFEINGDKTITLNINDEYKEQGAKAIEFGIDLSKNIQIESNLDTSNEGEYVVIYTVKSSFKYKNIKRVRYINVINGGDNNE